MNTTTRACVLCGGAATVTDWAPVATWLAVEGCQCGGFLVWTPVWDSRLTDMSDMERQDLSERIRAARARGSEAWVGSTDGQVTGPLVISQSGPRRSSQPSPRPPSAWIVLRDLRKAERDLATIQQAEPDPERAGHLRAVRTAIAELETTFGAPLPEN